MEQYILEGGISLLEISSGREHEDSKLYWGEIADCSWSFNGAACTASINEYGDC